MDNPLLWGKVHLVPIFVSNPTDLSPHQAHAHEFPITSRIARDYLAIPGVIVSVEQLFPKSRHLCTDQQSENYHGGHVYEGVAQGDTFEQRGFVVSCDRIYSSAIM